MRDGLRDPDSEGREKKTTAATIGLTKVQWVGQLGQALMENCSSMNGSDAK